MSKVAISTPLVVSMEDTLKSWKMQRASSIPYPFDTQRATLKMEDMVDILRKIADCSRKLKTLQHRNIR